MSNTQSRINQDDTRKRIDEVECPACRGSGFAGPIGSEYNCVWCKGAGTCSEDDALAFGADE